MERSVFLQFNLKIEQTSFIKAIRGIPFSKNPKVTIGADFVRCNDLWCILIADRSFITSRLVMSESNCNCGIWFVALLSFIEFLSGRTIFLQYLQRVLQEKLFCIPSLRSSWKQNILASSLRGGAPIKSRRQFLFRSRNSFSPEIVRTFFISLARACYRNLWLTNEVLAA